MDLKKNIKAHGWTLSAIAEKLSITQSALTQNINGNPTLSRLQEIADVMSISVSELVSESPDKHVSGLVCPECGAHLRLVKEED